MSQTLRNKRAVRTLPGAPKVIAGRKWVGSAKAARVKSEGGAPAVLSEAGRAVKANTLREYQAAREKELREAWNGPRTPAPTRRGVRNLLPKASSRFPQGGGAAVEEGRKEWLDEGRDPAMSSGCDSFRLLRTVSRVRPLREVLSVFQFEGWEPEEMARAGRWFEQWESFPTDFEGRREWLERWGFAPAVARVLAGGRR